MTTLSDAYRAALSSAVLLDRSDRVRIAIFGPDRAKFLHNLTTNDVKRLTIGHGLEAFVTTLQGKTLGYITVLALPDHILVRADPGSEPLILPHFRKFGFFDEVEIVEPGEPAFEYHLAGPASEAILSQVAAELPPAGELRHILTTIAEKPVLIVRESPLGLPGLSFSGDRAHAPQILEAIHRAQGSEDLSILDPTSAEVLRIEAGTPVFARDITADNLPQEVARDSRAINFVKGCYLGQETVARIDALGHVNKTLRGLQCEGTADDLPPPGSSIEADGKGVGTITSSAFSPRTGGVVALAYLRTRVEKAGTDVSVSFGDARRAAVVVDLPMR